MADGVVLKVHSKTAGQSHSSLSPFTNWLNVRLTALETYTEAGTYLISDSSSG